MRYKNNVLDKLVQMESTVSRIQVQINRNMSQEEISDSLEFLRAQIEGTREMISIEPDEFENQFAG